MYDVCSHISAVFLVLGAQESDRWTPLVFRGNASCPQYVHTRPAVNMLLVYLALHNVSKYHVL